MVLRPLVLVLKSILKQNSLGDVAFGGLGSWSLANMCIAHLMVRGRQGCRQSAQADKGRGCGGARAWFVHACRRGVDAGLQPDTSLLHHAAV